MNRKIDISQNKILKLTNVLQTEISIQGVKDYLTLVTQMENYIKSKGANPIGPLIQKTLYCVSEDGQPSVKIFLMRQVDNFIHNIESPYTINSLVKIRNCIYARYIGPEEKMKLAYDKINVFAFEEDIELSNESYTVFVNQQEDNIVVDVFMEKVDDK